MDQIPMHDPNTDESSAGEQRFPQGDRTTAGRRALVVANEEISGEQLVESVLGRLGQGGELGEGRALLQERARPGLGAAGVGEAKLGVAGRRLDARDRRPHAQMKREDGDDEGGDVAGGFQGLQYLYFSETQRLRPSW